MQTTFKVSDIHVPDVAGMFTTFKVRKQALFVDVSQFTDPSHYVKMMGFDRPIDFKFDQATKDSIEDTTTSKDNTKQ